MSGRSSRVLVGLGGSWRVVQGLEALGGTSWVSEGLGGSRGSGRVH